MPEAEAECLRVMDDMNIKFMEFFRTMLDRYGPEISGLYNYYRNLLDNNHALNQRDRYMIALICKKFRRGCSLHEMGAGAAQAGQVLSLLGYTVTASETDPNRFNLACALAAKFKTGCTLFFGDSFSLAGRFDLYFMKNVACKTFNFMKDVRWFKEKIAAGSKILFNAMLYGEPYGEKTMAEIIETMESEKIAFDRLDFDFIFMKGVHVPA